MIIQPLENKYTVTETEQNGYVLSNEIFRTTFFERVRPYHLCFLKEKVKNVFLYGQPASTFLIPHV